MHPSKQALMSLLKKQEKPQSKTASFTIVPSLQSKSKSLELHCEWTETVAHNIDTKVKNEGRQRMRDKVIHKLTSLQPKWFKIRDESS